MWLLTFAATKIAELKKIRVGIVNYLNTRPLLFGLKRPPAIDHVELIEDFPARLCELLIDDKIDIGLVPVAIIPELSEYHIIGDHCIGTEGEIASVALFSDVRGRRAARHARRTRQRGR